MLSSLREMLRSKVAVVLVGLLILSLAVWGISDIFRGGLGESIAKAGEQRLLQRTFQRRIDTYLLNAMQQTDEVITRRDIARDGTLDRLFGEELRRLVQLGYADRLGAIASDGAIAADAQSIEAFQNPSTGRFDAETYRFVLDRNSIRASDYELDVRERLSLNYLREGLGAAISVPDIIAQPSLDFLTETRDIIYVDIPEAYVPAPEPASEADIAAFYEENKAGFEIPERRGLSVLSFTPQDYVATVDITEDEIAEAYEALKLRDFTGKPQLRLSYLTYADEQTAGSALASLSVGTEKTDLSGDLAPLDTLEVQVSENDLPNEDISADVFGPLSEVGAVFGPYPAGEAFQLVLIEELLPGEVTPLEDVRDQVRQRLAETKADDAFLDAADEAVRLLGGGFSLAEIADAVGAPIISYAPVAANGATEDARRLNGVLSVPDGLRIAQELTAGEISDPIESGADYFALLRVDTVEPPFTPSLESVRSDVETILANQRRADAARLFAEDLEARLVRDETSLAAEAERIESVVTTLQDVDRREPPRSLSPALLNRAYDALSPTFISIPNRQGGVTIARVEDIRKGDGDIPLADIRASLADVLTTDLLNAGYQELAKAVELEVDDAAYSAIRSAAVGDE